MVTQRARSTQRQAHKLLDTFTFFSDGRGTTRTHTHTHTHTPGGSGICDTGDVDERNVVRTTPCSGRHAGLFVLNTHKVINLLSAVTNLLVAAACCSHSHDPDGKYVEPLNLNFGHLLPEPCCAATRKTRFLAPCICREEEPAHVSSCCPPTCPATFCARTHTHTPDKK